MHQHIKRVLVIVSLLAACIGAQPTIAQEVSLIDSLRKAKAIEPSFLIKLDMRNGFIDGRASKLRGVKFGWRHGEILQYGVGVNWLRDDPGLGFPLLSDSVDYRLRMLFVSGFAQYTFYRRGNWTVSIPAQIGFGQTWIKNKTEDQRETDFSHPMMTYEAMMVPEYRFLKYFQVGVAVGYRLGWIFNRQFDYGFSSPMYALVFKIRLGDIWKDVSPNDG